MTQAEIPLSLLFFWGPLQLPPPSGDTGMSLPLFGELWGFHFAGHSLPQRPPALTIAGGLRLFGLRPHPQPDSCFLPFLPQKSSCWARPCSPARCPGLPLGSGGALWGITHPQTPPGPVPPRCPRSPLPLPWSVQPQPQPHSSPRVPGPPGTLPDPPPGPSWKPMDSLGTP